MRFSAIALIALLAVGGCAHKPGFSWSEDAEAIPDAHTAIMISLAIFRGQVNRDIGDDKELEKKLEAFRYRTSDSVHDPKGDAWLVQATAEEKTRFDKACAGQCVGGELYIMALSAHDGRLLELYIPQ